MGAKKTPDEQLRDGLGTALVERPDVVDDETNYLDIPPELKDEFKKYEEAEILENIAEAERDGTFQMINFGIWHLALKEKRKKYFKKSIEEERGKAGYMRVWRAMSYARAYLMIPEIAGQGFRAAVKVLKLAPRDRDLYRAELIGVDPQTAKIVTKNLLEKLDEDRLDAKDQRAATGRKPVDPEKRREENLRLIQKHADEQWENVLDKWATALIAMQNLAGACSKIKEWKTEYVQLALEKKMVVKLGDEWDDIVKFLHPYETMRLLGMTGDD